MNESKPDTLSTINQKNQNELGNLNRSETVTKKDKLINKNLTFPPDPNVLSGPHPPPPPPPDIQSPEPPNLHIGIWNCLKSNFKYVLISALVIIIQFLLYHVPNINAYLIKLSPDHSTYLKLIISFIVIYWCQKEIHRLFINS